MQNCPNGRVDARYKYHWIYTRGPRYGATALTVPVFFVIYAKSRALRRTDVYKPIEIISPASGRIDAMSWILTVHNVGHTAYADDGYETGKDKLNKHSFLNDVAVQREWKSTDRRFFSVTRRPYTDSNTRESRGRNADGFQSRRIWTRTRIQPVGAPHSVPQESTDSDVRVGLFKLLLLSFSLPPPGDALFAVTYILFEIDVRDIDLNVGTPNYLCMVLCYSWSIISSVLRVFFWNLSLSVISRTYFVAMSRVRKQYNIKL